MGLNGSDFNIEEVNRASKSEWDEFVHSTTGGTFFHLYDWLEITAYQAGYQLMPVMIRDRGGVVGIAPFYRKKMAGITVCVSPPSKMSTPWAGPVFKIEQKRPNKIQKKSDALLKALHEYLTEKAHADYINITTTPEITDVRPMKWLSYNSMPLYTYMVNIENIDNAYNNFEKKIKSEIRRTQKKEEISYHCGDKQYFYKVLESVKQRYEEQGKTYPISSARFEKILSSDLKQYVTTRSVVTHKGFVTGMILIVYKDLIHHWIGAVKPLQNYPGACDYLHWNIIKEFAEKGAKKYELMGGNTRHLIEHKARYNGNLIPYFNSEWYNRKGRFLKEAMKVKKMFKTREQ